MAVGGDSTRARSAPRRLLTPKHVREPVLEPEHLHAARRASDRRTPAAVNAGRVPLFDADAAVAVQVPCPGWYVPSRSQYRDQSEHHEEQQHRTRDN